MSQKQLANRLYPHRPSSHTLVLTKVRTNSDVGKLSLFLLIFLSNFSMLQNLYLTCVQLENVCCSLSTDQNLCSLHVICMKHLQYGRQERSKQVMGICGLMCEGIDCLQSVSLSFLYQSYRNNTQKEYAGHKIQTRMARSIGTR